MTALAELEDNLQGTVNGVIDDNKSKGNDFLSCIVTTYYYVYRG